MTPVKILLEPHYEGDAWPGMDVGPVIINDAQPIVALASCRMQFRSKEDNTVIGFEFNSVVAAGKGLIIISDVNTWDIKINSQSFPLVNGKWLWDFETTDANGLVLTLYSGHLKVNKDVSYD